MTDLPRTRAAPNPLLAMAASLAAGILFAHSCHLQSKLALIFCAVIVTCAGLAAVLLVRRPLAGTLALIFAFCATGTALAVNHEDASKQARLSQLLETESISVSDPLELTGVIEGQPEPAPESIYLTVRAQKILVKGVESDVTGRVLLLARFSSAQTAAEYDALDLRHGARVRVLTTLDREDDFRNPGVQPFTEYLERNGYDATAAIKSPLLIERLDDERVFLPLAWLYRWREILQKSLARLFSPETAGVLNAALLGNHYNISGPAAERLRAGGTFHVLVISGFQIAFVGGLMLVLARWFTKRRLMQFLSASTCLWCYAIAVGAEASVVRSAVMFTLLALAPLVMRRANTLNGLGGAALALLVWQPDDLIDPSFQLTFLSVLAIVTIAVPIVGLMQRVGEWRPTHETPYPPDCARWFRSLSEALFWSEREWRADLAVSNIQYRLFKDRWAMRLERWRVQRMFRFALAAIIVSASVQIGMLPIMITYFHRVSLAALVLNIFAGIAMAAISLLGLLAVFVSSLSLPVSLLVRLVEKIEWVMVHSVDPFGRIGLASLRLPHYHGGAATIYALYFVLLAFLVIALRRWNPLGPPVTEATSRLFRPAQIRLAACLVTVVLAVILIHPFSKARADGQLHIDYLDVGQGDCALVTMPDGTTLLIDGGGRPNFDREQAETDEEPFVRDTRSVGERVVSEFLWARGLDRIDYVLATHADADHIDGLNDVARNFHVRGAIVARTPPGDPEYAKFAATMLRNGVPVYQVGAGDVLRVGRTEAEVVWPLPRADGRGSYGNNDGLVLRLRFGEKSFLFTADIESKAESAILARPVDLKSDVVKVAHHGSRTSSTTGLVNATGAQLAIISVGRRSMFGHPNKEVVERWQARGTAVMTTGARGTITISTDGRWLSVGTFQR